MHCNFHALFNSDVRGKQLFLTVLMKRIDFFSTFPTGLNLRGDISFPKISKRVLYNVFILADLQM